MIDYLIVGSGLAGSVIAERIANVLKKEVLIVERRDHIGGNIYDYYNESVILVHKYGPHIFHTNSEKVWNYLSKFTKWHEYEHKVLAQVDDKLVPIPFNFNAIKLCFPQKRSELLIKALTDHFGYNKKIPIIKLKETQSTLLAELAEYIYINIFLNYNLKQWGRRPEELDPSVTARVPVFSGYDNRYFYDKYQAIPSEGYSALNTNMLDNMRIQCELNTDFFQNKDKISYKYLIYTGPIDEFFQYKYGHLEYRSLVFNFKTYRKKRFQRVAQINYPNQYDYTRITEFKHLTGQEHASTTIAYEYPLAYKAGENEPYYPVPEIKNNDIYEKYREEAKQLDNILFVGRLAEYKYYNMDQVIARALHIFDSKIK